MALFTVWVAAVSFVAGCSKEPERTDARITALESNLDRMARDMETLRLQLTQNEATVLRLSSTNNKPPLLPAANPPIANGSGPRH